MSILTGKPEGKRSFGKPWHRWEDINTDFEVIKLEGMDWIHVVQGMDHCQPPANTVTNLSVLLNVRNFLSS
jgi:hypothetical protein